MSTQAPPPVEPPQSPKTAPAPAQPSSGKPAKKRKASPTPSRRDRLASIGNLSDDESVSSSRPKEHKRTRVHFSCVECHRRKQKCDRKEPCSQCVARRVPHLCRPFLNGVEDPSTADVQTRLSSIEGLLSRLVTSLPSALARVVDPTSAPDLESLLQGQGEDVFHPASADPQGDPPKQTMPHKPPPSGLFPSSIAQSHSATSPPARVGYGWGLREGRLVNLLLEDSTDLKDLLGTLKESGVSKSHLEWLIAGVPGRRMADGLVELYFRDIDWTRYKIDKPSFLRKYEAFFDSIGRNPTNPKVDGDTLRWLPLMFIVLAIATLSSPHEIVPTSDQAAWSRRFYGSARSSLEYAKALQRDNLDVLFAGLLASRYMLLTRRPAEGSTPLTTAFQLGLYRDGTVLNMTDKREVEVRRRAWAMLYHLDRTVSLLVGRPASISDAHTDTKMPANLDDEELDGDFDPAGHPMTRPTVYTYYVVRHKLAEIMGRIAYHTFAIQLPDYQRVLELDKELIEWRDSLPPFFHMTKPDLQHDKSHPYLFVQRHLLACEWYYTRITLNRPYLLRRKPQDSRYAYSKDAAIESATADLLSRRAFMMEKGNLIVNSGGYRVLNSYMVLGVTIKLDPDSAQADKLRHLLNVVSGRAPDSQGRVSEPLVKEELAIVEFLTAKTATSSKARQSSGKGKEETPVDLLLGLAKTRSGKRAAEEEQRQLRQQAMREQEEQKAAQRRQTGSNTSPWGYQPPSMPGLDVQQPFDNAGMRRQPRPLQPPQTKRSSGTMLPPNTQSGPVQTLAQAAAAATAEASNSMGWPDNAFDNIDLSIRPASAHSTHHQQNPQPFTMQQGSNQQFNGPSPTYASPLGSGTGSAGGGPGDQTLYMQQNYHISPYNNMAALPQQTQQGQNQEFGLEQFIQSMQSQGQNQNGQFGMTLPPIDGFDFNDLTMGTDVMQMGGQGGFNPFALPQTEDGAPPADMSGDDETQFLNYILTKFANSQPEVQ